MYKIHFTFAKTGYMKYISHLDLMRLFFRAMRRAEFPLKLSEGFNPHPKFSIKNALKLGLESDHEEAFVGLTQLMNYDEFRDKLNIQLPEGIVIKDVQGNFS